MSRRLTLITAVLLAPAAFAQQDMQNMPGMNMPAPAKPKQQQHTTQAPPTQAPPTQASPIHSKPDTRLPVSPTAQGLPFSANSMPGMNMSQPSSLEPGPDFQKAGPLDRKLPSGPATAVREADQSLQNSAAQQQQNQGVVPNDSSDQGSLHWDMLGLQEQENPGFHTGQNLPAPELLGPASSGPVRMVEDFLALSEKNNPTLAQVRQDIARSHAQGRQAGLMPNPTVGYNGEHIRGGQYQGGQQGAYVQQEFVLGRKLKARRNIYQQEAATNQQALNEQTFRVKATVEQAFYSALSAQAMVVVRQRMLQLALDSAETSHQMSNIGQDDAADVLESEVDVDQARIDFERAQRDYLSRFAELAAVAGSPHLPPGPLHGDLQHPPELNAKAEVANILSQSPSVARARQEVEVAQARLADAHREVIPNLTVRAGEWYDFEQITGPGSYTGPMSFADASIKLPLWNHNQGNIAAAQTDVERARLDVTRTELTLRHDAEPMAQQYLSSRFEVDRYRTQMLPRAKRAYDLYLTKYQQMAVNYPKVLDAQRTFFRLQMAYLDALHTEWTNAIGLQNFTLMQGLEMPTTTGRDSTTMNLPNPNQ